VNCDSDAFADGEVKDRVQETNGIFKERLGGSFRNVVTGQKESARALGTMTSTVRVRAPTHYESVCSHL
ncbi:hypothetical protein M5D96_010417, partial [Drosophila gunungcola]